MESANADGISNIALLVVGLLLQLLDLAASLTRNYSKRRYKGSIKTSISKGSLRV